MASFHVLALLVFMVVGYANSYCIEVYIDPPVGPENARCQQDFFSSSHPCTDCSCNESGTNYKCCYYDTAYKPIVANNEYCDVIFDQENCVYTTNTKSTDYPDACTEKGKIL
ncbi:uncharacterized protein [Apostichopus japonicus]|uniref:uncharacterized protein isoform X1 n=1 Tax=Stichopus japonicus TaxID=307972 RepID=UPI003AB4182A